MKKAIYVLVLLFAAVFILVLVGLIYIVHNPNAADPILDRIALMQGRWEAWRNPLTKYGVSYKWDHGEHYEVTMLDFWLQTDKGKIAGPSFIGDNLTLDFEREGDDPIPEIVVRSGGDRDVAQLVVKDGKAVGFHMEYHGVGIGFPAEGYYDN